MDLRSTDSVVTSAGKEEWPERPPCGQPLHLINIDETRRV